MSRALCEERGKEAKGAHPFEDSGNGLGGHAGIAGLDVPTTSCGIGFLPSDPAAEDRPAS